MCTAMHGLFVEMRPQAEILQSLLPWLLGLQVCTTMPVYLEYFYRTITKNNFKNFFLANKVISTI
jgi:hypothetical protein